MWGRVWVQNSLLCGRAEEDCRRPRRQHGPSVTKAAKDYEEVLRCDSHLNTFAFTEPLNTNEGDDDVRDLVWRA